MVTKGILAWGSSSIEGLQAALTLMSDSFGAAYHNGGISGAYANTILAAQGSRPALVGFAGGIRPDSTPQPITVSNVQAIGTIRPLTGTLEGTGVTGTLSWSPATGWQFSRSDGGGAVAVAGPLRFIPDAPDLEPYVEILNIGKNDMLWGGNTAGVAVQATGTAYQDVQGRADVVLVMGHFVTAGGTLQSPQYANVMAANAALAQIYGAQYLDVQAYLMGAQIWRDTGLTPTAEDLARQAQGLLPWSLAADALHLNAAANLAITYALLRPHLIALGAVGDPRHVWGLGGADRLAGAATEDTLHGFAGDDTLRGGAGADLLDGGIGRDLASHAEAAGPVWADLADPRLNQGEAAGDSYIGIEDLEGSAGDDTLAGDAGGNRLEGLAGNDRLEGRAGDDTLSGGAGDDTLRGGAGADLFDGGEGRDLVSHAEAAAPVWADLADPRLNQGEAAGDSYSGIEDLEGSAGNDTLSGDAGGNRLDGMAGDDRISGGAGDDTLRGGAGADLFDGGEGRDLVSHAAAAAPVWADLAEPGLNQGEAAGDSYIGIEDLEGSAGNDTLAGDAGDNRLDGMAGNDRLQGRAGADLLSGGEGDDVLSGGAGADRLEGGAGRDLASYAEAEGPVWADLTHPGDNLGEAAGDRYTGIEDLEGSAGDDRLTGDGAANLLMGLAGDDRLSGQGGDDTLSGGAGDDMLLGGSGADLFDGGTGRDLVSYGGALGGVLADLADPAHNLGDAAGDRYTGIEDLEGSRGQDRLGGDGAANLLRGQAGADLLLGRAGADRLEGGNGADTLWGGGGADTLLGGSGRDVFVFQGRFGTDTLLDFRPGADLIDISDRDIPFDRLLGRAEATEAGVVLHIGAQNLLLAGLDLADLDPGMFLV